MNKEIKTHKKYIDLLKDFHTTNKKDKLQFIYEIYKQKVLYEELLKELSILVEREEWIEEFKNNLLI